MPTFYGDGGGTFSADYITAITMSACAEPRVSLLVGPYPWYPFRCNNRIETLRWAEIISPSKKAGQTEYARSGGRTDVHHSNLRYAKAPQSGWRMVHPVMEKSPKPERSPTSDWYSEMLKTSKVARLVRWSLLPLQDLFFDQTDLRKGIKSNVESPYRVFLRLGTSQ
ncbi:hypothetical protein ARMGADRAFT_1032018 [Armillaria gallica]|uniref:Uncharacterized protein n=1 Tax=Armillaria gallica TaxID=47427 RepID=A0A2H3DJ83_ARMGA|nr:hypothetical protein ARMGADRAFT_1032018 [Armillaria gallica]